MAIVIPEVLSTAEVEALRDSAQALSFTDGAATAGAHAKEVKANHQATDSPELDSIRAKISDALQSNGMVISAARPRLMTPLILSRYRQGQTYGTHVDDALMRGLRTDLSYTLFLSDPATYDGGALVIEDMLESREVKLEAGDMILYASTTLHRVSPVTRGERLAAVGWIQSWIRSAEQREILLDLDLSINELFASQGKTPVFDRLTKTRSNLLRQWADA